MAAKKSAAPEVEPEVKEDLKAEVPGWPGVLVETPEEHDAKRRAEADALA